jgi:hypothetical protein
MYREQAYGSVDVDAGAGVAAGAKYGIFVGLLMLVLTKWAPQPAGLMLLWAALSVQSARALWIAWHRLRLPWFSAGIVAALIVSLAMIPISAAGLDVLRLE